MPDTITDLLNKVSAMVKCQVSSFQELSSDTKIPVRQLYELVNQRRSRPNGERAVILHKWAARKSNQIALLPRKIHRRYRECYREACSKFPVNWKE